jgi:hypothetical protein
MGVLLKVGGSFNSETRCLLNVFVGCFTMTVETLSIRRRFIGHPAQSGGSVSTAKRAAYLMFSLAVSR